MIMKWKRGTCNLIRFSSAGTYGSIRNKVKKIVADVDPAQAPVILLPDVIKLSQHRRALLNLCVYLGWRLISTHAMKGGDIIQFHNGTTATQHIPDS